MNWILFLITLFLATVIEMSLIDLLEVGGVRPSLVAVLSLFLALWAPRMTALWGCFVCGLVIDLTSPWVWGSGSVSHLIGPHALGYVFACALILQVRSMVMRRQVFAIAVLTGVFVLMAGIVVIAIATVRSWYSPELAELSAAHELLRRVGMAAYSALLAVPLGWLLVKSFTLWRFPASQPTSTSWR